MAVLTADFSAFVESAQPRLRLALGSAFGFELAEEATAEALAFAWENWERVGSMENPVGYVFGVGRNKIKRTFKRRRHPQLPPVRATDLPWVEPRLPVALSRLPERQRQVVMLLHCFQWTLSEVAAVLDLSKGTVQIHDRRGLATLRRELGCGND